MSIEQSVSQQFTELVLLYIIAKQCTLVSGEVDQSFNLLNPGAACSIIVRHSVVFFLSIVCIYRTWL